MTIRGIAWAAGLYEGEGSIGMARAHRYSRLALGMTDQEPVEWFREILGFGSIRPQPRENYKTMYRFEGGGWVHTAQTYIWFEPYLSPRRLAQFNAVLEQKPVRPTSPDCGRASDAGYHKHLQNGEPSCEQCRLAHTTAERKRRGYQPRYADKGGYMRTTNAGEQWNPDE